MTESEKSRREFLKLVSATEAMTGAARTLAAQERPPAGRGTPSADKLIPVEAEKARRLGRRIQKVL